MRVRDFQPDSKAIPRRLRCSWLLFPVCLPDSDSEPKEATKALHHEANVVQRVGEFKASERCA
jgi:hypothetical protein